MLTSLWIVAENMGSFVGATAGGAAYDRSGEQGVTLSVRDTKPQY